MIYSLTKNPLVGIIVPIYNTAEYIERCLLSILNNTYSNIKVFCIDDGSDDESPDIIQKLVASDKRVVLIRQENSGVSVARNKGLEFAFEENCEVIGFVDSDDWVHPKYIETLLSGIMDGYDVSVCNCERTTTFSNEYCDIKNIDIVEYDLECIQNNQIVKKYIWGRLFRRSAIEKVRFTKGININEDTLFNIITIVSNNDLRLCWINEKLYFYFNREKSLLHSFTGQDLIGFIKECINLLSCICEKNKKSFLINIILTNTFNARYISKFEVDFLKNDIICKDLLKETWKIVKKDKIKLKNKFIFRLFSIFPLLYRLFRIVTDRTILDWEKQQKSLNK